ncbi:MAG: hypothetical protein JO099_04560, partial [Acidobacteriia bacterium]|nr:hypothetical protein [Terriglobia bacterium]
MQTLRQVKLAAIALFLVRVTMAQADSTGMVDMNAAGMSLMSLTSGSSENPASWPMPMIMTHFGNWNTMFMGNGFLSDIQQSGPRGGDKLYSTN